MYVQKYLDFKLFKCQVIFYYFLASVVEGLLRASLIAQLVKNPPAMQETPVGFLSQEDPLEKE